MKNKQHKNCAVRLGPRQHLVLLFYENFGQPTLTIRHCKPATRLFPSLGITPETGRQTKPTSPRSGLEWAFVVFPSPLTQAIVSFVGYQRPEK